MCSSNLLCVSSLCEYPAFLAMQDTCLNCCATGSCVTRGLHYSFSSMTTSAHSCAVRTTQRNLFMKSVINVHAKIENIMVIRKMCSPHLVTSANATSHCKRKLRISLQVQVPHLVASASATLRCECAPTRHCERSVAIFIRIMS